MELHKQKLPEKFQNIHINNNTFLLEFLFKFDKIHHNS